MSATAFLERTKRLFPYITIRDPSTCGSGLAGLRKSGASRIHVIADFDMTLTKHWIPSSTGQTRNFSSHAVLERGPAVSPSFAAHTKALAEHYYPLEIDPLLDMTQKVRLMVEWWTRAHEAMIEERITRGKVHDQAVAAHMTFRPGLTEFLDTLSHSDVPLLVFSAGIADVIEQLLHVNGLSRRNQVIVSNHMIFGARSDGEEEVLVGFREPLIHTFNKGEQALHDTSALSVETRDVLTSRKNVILLGDSIGDAKMANGVEHDVKLTIGFCNFGGDERRQEFLDTFDIVIEGDESLQWVTDLMRWIDGQDV